MIEIKNVSQSYGRKEAKKTLSDINLTIRENKITALVGANGAGKSTLLGVLSNITPILSGTVTLGGRDVRKIKTQDVAKKIAFLKQSQQMSIRITVGDLVEFGRFPHCRGRLGQEDKRKVDESLEYMNLPDLRSRYLDELSGGQRQRAFIAMILAQDTPYIFLDEPLNNLDIKYSVEMMKIIQNLVTERNKTIVLVLHDINFAAAYANHIVAMKNGQIVREGCVKDVIKKEVLNTVFDHDFHIAECGGKNVCLYFDQVQN
ncbi:MAG: ATP-binding cassette domain-containing protein [Oscillospiraceae bacterium]|nr:ATP-binding cassette domain-containing protein [Oscillospiraceae bacterium]